VASMLAQTLGQEKSAEVVGVAAAALGYRGPTLDRGQVDHLLDNLARAPGLIGIAARFAQRRVQAVEERAPPSSVRPVSERQPPSDPHSRIRNELVALLAQSLGVEKAEEEVAAAARRLGVGEKVSAAQATSILEDLAKSSGPIGATARFAKARFLLRK
jgi:hypothetical protein